MARTKTIVLTSAEADLPLDLVPVRNAGTRNLALKLAGIVLEFESDIALDAVAEILAAARRARPIPIPIPIPAPAAVVPAPAIYSYGHVPE